MCNESLPQGMRKGRLPRSSPRFSAQMRLSSLQLVAPQARNLPAVLTLRLSLQAWENAVSTPRRRNLAGAYTQGSLPPPSPIHSLPVPGTLQAEGSQPVLFWPFFQCYLKVPRKIQDFLKENDWKYHLTMSLCWPLPSPFPIWPPISYPTLTLLPLTLCLTLLPARLTFLSPLQPLNLSLLWLLSSSTSEASSTTHTFSHWLSHEIPPKFLIDLKKSYK